MSSTSSRPRSGANATPPRITGPSSSPPRRSVSKEPEWPEAGLELYDEFAGEGKGTTAGPVTAEPGRVIVSIHSDFHVCVTLETYTRRPPVETRGWDSVVEVGYANRSGEMSFMDGLSGTELPDLSLNGREGNELLGFSSAFVSP